MKRNFFNMVASILRRSELYMGGMLVMKAQPAAGNRGLPGHADQHRFAKRRPFRGVGARDAQQQVGHVHQVVLLAPHDFHPPDRRWFRGSFVGMDVSRIPQGMPPSAKAAEHDNSRASSVRRGTARPEIAFLAGGRAWISSATLKKTGRLTWAWVLAATWENPHGLGRGRQAPRFLGLRAGHSGLGRFGDEVADHFETAETGYPGPTMRSRAAASVTQVRPK